MFLLLSNVQYKTMREEVKPVSDPGGNATEVSVTAAMTTISKVPPAALPFPGMHVPVLSGRREKALSFCFKTFSFITHRIHVSELSSSPNGSVALEPFAVPKSGAKLCQPQYLSSN